MYDESGHRRLAICHTWRYSHSTSLFEPIVIKEKNQKVVGLLGGTAIFQLFEIMANG